MSPPATGRITSNSSLLPTVREIRSARRTADAIEVLRRFERTVVMGVAHVEAGPRPAVRGTFAPDWMKVDLLRRQLDEEVHRLVDISLELDAVSLSGCDPGTVFQRHTDQCVRVRALRRRLEREGVVA